jgi:hypothetical protein
MQLFDIGRSQTAENQDDQMKRKNKIEYPPYCHSPTRTGHADI